MSDGELNMIHYYVQKGFDWDKLCSLTPSEKVFLKASMELEIENEVRKYKALFGTKRR